MDRWVKQLSVAIMAHKKRKRHVDGYLKPLLLNATVVWDRKNDRWDTGRRSLLAFDPNAKWHLVVQDDALLCPRFLATVCKALKHVPDVPVAFYVGKAAPHGPGIRRTVQRALDEGRPWIVTRGPLWGPAVATPTKMIDEMVSACDLSTTPNYDLRMAEYHASQGHSCWYSIPNLVDHRRGLTEPSLVPGRGASKARTSQCFATEELLDDVDWSAKPLSVPAADWRRVRAKPTRATKRIYAMNERGQRVLAFAKGAKLLFGFDLETEKSSAG